MSQSPLFELLQSPDAEKLKAALESKTTLCSELTKRDGPLGESTIQIVAKTM